MTQEQRNKVALAFFIVGKFQVCAMLVCGFIRGRALLVGEICLVGAVLCLAASIYHCLVNFRIQAREEWKP